MNIYQRINKVMQEVTYIRKDRAVSGGGQNYTAVSYDNVIAQVRKSLVDNGIVIVTRQVDGRLEIKRDLTIDQKMHLYAGRYEIDFVNIEKPEDKVTVTIESHAADNGDKAPGKAITYATKSAILKVLSLETGDDEESRTAEIDLSAPLADIQNCETMEELGAVWKRIYTDFPDNDSRVRLTAAKDARKKELTNG